MIPTRRNLGIWLLWSLWCLAGSFYPAMAAVWIILANQNACFGLFQLTICPEYGTLTW